MLALLLCLAAAGACLWRVWTPSTPAPPAASPASGLEQPDQAREATGHDVRHVRSANSVRGGRATPGPAELGTQADPGSPRAVLDVTGPPSTPPSPFSRLLVSRLCPLDGSLGPLTTEQAAEWRQNLQQLVGLGATAVPAILEFLGRNVDLDYDSASGAFGYASARQALLAALVQVGGPEATAALLETLQRTGAPREVAQLAQHLETLAPGEHRQEATQAAREVLALAAEGQLEGTDVAPLFEVFQRYGDTTAPAELEQVAGQWKYYATLALAGLSDGGGIPSLVRLVEEESPAKPAALEMLAQLASQSPDARAALLEQVRANRIPDSTWPRLVSPLTGDRYGILDSVYEDVPSAEAPGVKTFHIQYGNQNYYTVPRTTSTPEQLSQRRALLDDLEAITTDPAALRALGQARNLLAPATEWAP